MAGSWHKAVGIGLLLALGACGTAAAQSSTPPTPAFAPAAEQPDDLPDGAGRDETFYACTACHNFRLVAAQGMTRAQWDDSLSWMTKRHNMADIQGADRDLILDYLEKNFPPKAPSRAGGWRNPFTPQ